MSKYTKGPWHVGERRGEHIAIKHSDNTPGAISWTLALAVARPTWAAEAEANARLIAAAPELLEALQDLMGVINAAGLHNLQIGVQLGPTVWFVKANDAMNYAARAVAKATGEQR